MIEIVRDSNTIASIHVAYYGVLGPLMKKSIKDFLDK